MKPGIALILALACLPAVRADEPFTKGLSQADFEAAGLGKLTPGELARLDALVGSRQAGAVAKTRDETARVVTEKVKAEALRQQSEGIVDRMKVILKPGTRIEYTSLDAEIAPPFREWEKGTVFHLSNGQLWVATDADDVYFGPPIKKPAHVKIIPGSMGSFFIDIEGCGRARVKFLGMAPVPKPSPAPQGN
ncbi:MAG TPA: hypothetical protein VGG34_15355 [Opitutaceae bacterium]|jgi:hypothetical protein